ncbi:hypothetical protein [Thermococcus piezophilus]|uniref:hypothetical protein n=1 Tax=Thermococcus piezophilus TaxID=1712654 RepID=UPI001F281C99|nr:hypothetical protein [Thermococcus piezophilus]
MIELVDMGDYKKAKDKLIIPMVLSLIFFSTISGILMPIGLILLPSKPSEALESKGPTDCQGC